MSGSTKQQESYTPVPETSSGRSWHVYLALAGIILLGLVFRIIHSKLMYVANFDTGTVSYMAVNILDGERPLFFYGQNYMGALEAYVAAFYMWISGQQTDFVTSLSTITFAGFWMWATYLLFTEIRNRGSGLVAALLVAIPGYWTIKYSVWPFGGYTVAFTCATMALWIGIRIYKRNPQGGRLWTHALGLGFFAGVGMWTHYLVGPFCLVAGVFCLIHLVRNFRREVLWPYVCGGLLGVLGLVPAILMSGEVTGSHTRGFIFSGEQVTKAWDVFQGHNVKRLLFWDVQGTVVRVLAEGKLAGPNPPVATAEQKKIGETVEDIWRVVLGVCLAVGFLSYVFAIFRAPKNNRLPLLAPLFYILIFLAFFIPHHLAHEHAPRYVMNMIVMFLAMTFALGMMSFGKRWRQVGFVFLGLFLASQMAGQIIHIAGWKKKAEDRRYTYSFIAEAAKKTGADYITPVTGDRQYMHEGQIFNFMTGNHPIFVAPLDERVQANAQAFETSERIAWTCQSRSNLAVPQAFVELAYPVDRQGDWKSQALFWERPPDYEYTLPVRKAVPLMNMAMALNGNPSDLLIDRDIRTTSNRLAVVLFEFQKPVVPHSIWITSPDPLPRHMAPSYVVKVQKKGSPPQIVNGCPQRIADSYRIGDRVYFKGYFPRQEIILGKVDGPVNYLSIERHPDIKKANWKFNEIHVFTSTGQPLKPVSTAYNAAVARLQSGSLDFIIADRRASATLLEDVRSDVAYPRWNSKYPATLMSRIVHPRDGLAVLVDKALVNECVDTIATWYKEECVAEVLSGEADMYALIVFQGDWPMQESGLVWNGHTILSAYEPSLLTWGDQPPHETNLEEIAELRALNPKLAEKQAIERKKRAIREAP